MKYNIVNYWNISYILLYSNVYYIPVMENFQSLILTKIYSKWALSFIFLALLESMIQNIFLFLKIIFKSWL